MHYRILKFCVGLAYITLLVLTWHFFRGGLDWGFAAGALAVSGFWLLITRWQLGALLRTYFDTLSRLQVLIPFWVGLLLAGTALVSTDNPIIFGLALLLMSWWLYIYVSYRRNRRQFIKQGHGPLPKDCWINPPAEALQPGDLILTSGRMAGRLQESVGHGELVILNPNGMLSAFSCYMQQGAVLNGLAKLCRAWISKGEHYIALRLQAEFTPEQSQRATALACAMIAENQKWREKANRRRQALVARLPLPGSWRLWLLNKIKATGYDWPGLFIGTRAAERWTCIGSCLELYHRLGIKTRQYGTGLLGLGTGLLDPIMPVRFLADPAFRLLTLDNKSQFEQADRNPKVSLQPDPA